MQVTSVVRSVVGKKMATDDFYVRYYIGHKGKFGHEFLEFEFRPDGQVWPSACETRLPVLYTVLNPLSHHSLSVPFLLIMTFADHIVSVSEYLRLVLVFAQLRYANNSNYKNDVMIRKEAFVSQAVLDELKRMITESEVAFPPSQLELLEKSPFALSNCRGLAAI